VTTSSARPSAAAPVGPRPRTILVVCAALGLEVLALLAAAVLAAVGLLRGTAATTGAGVVIMLTALGVAALLAVCARGLWRGRRWPRSLAVTWQLLQAAIAVPQLGGEQAGWGVVLLVPVVAVIGGLLSPSGVAYTTGRHNRGHGSAVL